MVTRAPAISQPASFAGARLRALREKRGRTQLWVEAEAEIGTGYLQRVESGRVAQPGRRTIERILDALGATFAERIEIETAFGYLVASPLPTEQERRWARSHCQEALDEVAFPAYALDCSARLVAWNRFLPALIGRAGDSVLPAGLTERSMLFCWFDASTPLGALVVDPESLFPAMIRALRFELSRFRDADWPGALIAELRGGLPAFDATWRMLEPEALPVVAARARVPLRLRLPGGPELLFRLAAEPFTEDGRFRAIYYFPADAATLQWCASTSERFEENR
jgi:transcriptional regulator with XRE-family HTH domain